MNRIKNKTIFLTLLLTVLFVSVAYAALTTSLTIEESTAIISGSVARVDENYFRTVQDAINFIGDDGSKTVYLLKDVNEEVVVPVGKEVTINTNSFILSSNKTTITNAGTLTILESTVTSSGIATNLGNNIAIYNTGTLIIENSEVSSINGTSSYDSIAIDVEGSGYVNVIGTSTVSGGDTGIYSESDLAVIEIGSSDDDPTDTSTSINGGSYAINRNSSNKLVVFNSGELNGSTNPGYIATFQTPEGYYASTELIDGVYKTTLIEKAEIEVELNAINVSTLEEVASEEWVNKNLNINFDINISGGTVKYCIDQTNTCTPETIYENEFLISTEGIRYIRYYGINDVTGEESDIYTFVAEIDKTNPVANLDYSIDYVSSQVNFVSSSTDNVSGIEYTKIYYRRSDEEEYHLIESYDYIHSLTSEDSQATYYYYVEVTDYAGNSNTSSVHSFVLKGQTETCTYTYGDEYQLVSTATKQASCTAVPQTEDGHTYTTCTLDSKWSDESTVTVSSCSKSETTTTKIDCGYSCGKTWSSTTETNQTSCSSSSMPTTCNSTAKYVTCTADWRYYMCKMGGTHSGYCEGSTCCSERCATYGGVSTCTTRYTKKTYTRTVKRTKTTSHKYYTKKVYQKEVLSSDCWKDVTDPVINSVSVTYEIDNGNYISVFNIDASDPESGIDSIVKYIRVSGDADWTEVTDATTLNADTKYEYYITVTNGEGTSISSSVSSFTVGCPLTINAVKATTGTSVPSNAWSDEPINVTMSAGDNNFCSIKYCIDDGNTCTPSTAYSDTISFNEEAKKYLRYQVVNSEEATTSSVDSYIAIVDINHPVFEPPGILKVYAKEVTDDNYNLCKGVSLSKGSNNIACTSSMINASSLTSTPGDYTITYSYTDYLGVTANIDRTVTVLDNTTNFSANSTSSPYSTFVASTDGYYDIELWGAAGGRGVKDGTLDTYGGKGAYTSGTIYLEEGDTLYVYVGGVGVNAKDQKAGSAGGYNGGGTGGQDGNYTSSGGNEPGAGGGGATDVRLVSGTWNAANSLRSRIMVAGGGGGGTYSGTGGAGGTLAGTKGNNSSVVPTQTSGASFGAGQTGPNATAYTSGTGGGGGGYWGGTSYAAQNSSGGGGSSYISGYAGVNSVTSEDDTTASNSTLHYSGKYFINPIMIAGTEIMPSTTGATETGHSGAGAAKIEYIGKSSLNKVNSNLNNVRYIKSCAKGNSVNTGDHWLEIQAMKNGVNLAHGKSITGTVTSTDAHPYTYILDGDATTISNYSETSSEGYQCVTVDLGSNNDLDDLALWHYWSDSRTYYDKNVYVSSDGDNYRDLIIDPINYMIENPLGIHYNPYSKDATVIYNINNSRSFTSTQYCNTDYKINWDNDFAINIKFNVGTLAKRYLLFGGYNSSSTEELNVEVNASNKIRVYFGTGQVDSVSTASVVANTDISLTFVWHKATNKWSVVATGTGVNISMSGTYTMTGNAANGLRIGGNDHRTATSPFSTINVISFSATKNNTYGSSYGTLLQPVMSGSTFGGWYTDPTGGSEVTSSSTISNSYNNMLYAHWQ